MVTSILLAKFLGLIFVPFGLIFLFNRTLFDKFIATLPENPIFFIFSGFINLIIGSFIIAAHNNWDANWTVVITIIGWVLFVSGLLRLSIPYKLLQFIQSTNLRRMTLIAGIVMLLIGLFLLYHGYVTGYVTPGWLDH